MIKKLFYSVLVFFVMGTFLLYSKSKAKFIHKNLLQVIAYAKGSARGNQTQKRIQCFEAGKIIAQARAIKILESKSWPNVKMIRNPKSFSKKKVYGIIRGGYLYKTSYNKYSNRCTVVYRIAREEKKAPQKNKP